MVCYSILLNLPLLINIVIVIGLYLPFLYNLKLLFSYSRALCPKDLLLVHRRLELYSCPLYGWLHTSMLYIYKVILFVADQAFINPSELFFIMLYRND